MGASILSAWKTRVAGWILVLSTTLAFLTFARVAMSDMPLTFLTTLSVALGVRACQPRPAPWTVPALGAALGLGFATKGPIALLVPGLAFLLLSRVLREHGREKLVRFASGARLEQLLVQRHRLALGLRQLAEGGSLETGQGLPELKQRIRAAVGAADRAEGSFSARQRHIDALKWAGRHLAAGRREMVATGSGELLAEELRLAQEALGEITGAVSSDDLLGRIFSEFRIGK